MISVVIPVYRSEDTLRRCVESLQAQTYGEIEIIIVVDKLPDASGQLADELAAGEGRIKVIHQDNRGVSYARNTGINAAGGTYLQFLDSDDYLEPDACENMVRVMENTGGDLVIAGFHHWYMGRDYVKMPKVEGLFSLREEEGVFLDLYEAQLLNMPWNKLYRRELVRKGFPQDMNLGEDLLFNLTYMEGNGNFALLRSAVCNYIQDDRGTTLSTGKRRDRVETALRLFQETADFCGAVYGGLSDRGEMTLKSKTAVEFLDHMESLAFDGEMSRGEAVSIIREHKKAWEGIKGKGRPRLGLLDYRIIYFLFNGNWPVAAYWIIKARGVVVRLVRRVRNGR